MYSTGPSSCGCIVKMWGNFSAEGLGRPLNTEVKNYCSIIQRPGGELASPSFGRDQFSVKPKLNKKRLQKQKCNCPDVAKTKFRPQASAELVRALELGCSITVHVHLHRAWAFFSNRQRVTAASKCKSCYRPQNPKDAPAQWVTSWKQFPLFVEIHSHNCFLVE